MTLKAPMSLNGKGNPEAMDHSLEVKHPPAEPGGFPNWIMNTFKHKKRHRGYAFATTLSCLALFLACDTKKTELALQAELQINNELKSKIQELSNELNKLKETGEYHYQKGIEYKNKSDFLNAKIEFETTISKFPDSAVQLYAKKELSITIEKINEENQKSIAAIEAKNAEKKKEDIISSYPLYTSYQISDACEQNRARFGSEFKNKKIRITGTVWSNTGRRITFYDGLYHWVFCEFNYDLTKYDKGSRVTVIGTYQDYDGSGAGGPMFICD